MASTKAESMKIHRMPWRMLAAACVALALTACDNGPFEKAGKAVDRAGEKVRDKVKDVTK